MVSDAQNNVYKTILIYSLHPSKDYQISSMLDFHLSYALVPFPFNIVSCIVTANFIRCLYFQEFFGIGSSVRCTKKSCKKCLEQRLFLIRYSFCLLMILWQSYANYFYSIKMKLISHLGLSLIILISCHNWITHFKILLRTSPPLTEYKIGMTQRRNIWSNLWAFSFVHFVMKGFSFRQAF